MKLFVLLILCIFLVSCTNNAIPTKSVEDPVSVLSCKTDADCVPAQCCHATSCVNKENAPDCSDVFCTLSCEIGTTDCGGGCYCDEGKCSAILYGEDGSLTKVKWR